MTIKRYEVPGMMEWHPVFKVGRSRLLVSFTGGHLCGGAAAPAFYATSDPVVQAVIENSAAFRSRRIRLACESCESADHMPDSGKTDHPPIAFEYDDIEDIYEYLQREKGVPIEQLCDNDSCFREAKRLGITLRKKPRSPDSRCLLPDS